MPLPYTDREPPTPPRPAPRPADSSAPCRRSTCAAHAVSRRCRRKAAQRLARSALRIAQDNFPVALPRATASHWPLSHMSDTSAEAAPRTAATRPPRPPLRWEALRRQRPSSTYPTSCPRAQPLRRRCHCRQRTAPRRRSAHLQAQRQMRSHGEDQ
eukprot:9504057-Pyramimonas_sp.AAC.3